MQEGENNNNRYSSVQNISRLWLGGDNHDTPTLQIWPLGLAECYQLDKPCLITLEGKPELGGVLIKYLGPKPAKKEKLE